MYFIFEGNLKSLSSLDTNHVEGECKANTLLKLCMLILNNQKFQSENIIS